jgi:hypothetical protein
MGWWRVFVILLIFCAIGLVLKAAGFVVVAVVALALGIAALLVVVYLLRAIYHFFNPAAKKAYQERCAQEAADANSKRQNEEAEAKAEALQAKAIADQVEHERQQFRDASQQSSPYTYQIGKHGNESLAIRYGIANQVRKVKEYWFYAPGGERKRNPDRDRIFYEPASTIRVQKTRRLSADLYEVLLSDHNNRKAKAIIEAGTEYVKTFYPLDDEWFSQHADLEETLKGNGTFSLKELATFHVQKAVGR